MIIAFGNREALQKANYDREAAIAIYAQETGCEIAEAIRVIDETIAEQRQWMKSQGWLQDEQL